jgi:FtsZ-binding cell division protein ZapB
MPLGRYDYDRRYRRRFWRGFLKVLLIVGLLLGVGLFSYQMGIEQLKARDASMREENASLSRQKTELELLASQMQHAARTAEGRAAELEARLQREVPAGDLATLTRLVSERLNSGMDPNRLAFVISQSQAPRNCQQPETKRFTITTPLTRGGTRSTSIGNGRVIVSGEGKSARDAKGAPESWFDPAEPVTIKITTIDGKETIVEGILPLQRSVVADNTEYRFTFGAGPRSFVEVTADRCPFP